MKKWFFSNVMQKSVSKAANYYLGRECSNLFAFVKKGSFENLPQIIINEEELIRLNRRDNRYRAVLCLMRMTTNTDILTYKGIDLNFEEHHIFPKAVWKKSIKEANNQDSICNILLISRESNLSISDAHPSNYMGSLVTQSKQDGISEDLRERFRKAMLPDFTKEENLSLLSSQNYHEFLHVRASLILSKLKDVLSDALFVGTAPDDEIDD